MTCLVLTVTELYVHGELRNHLQCPFISPNICLELFRIILKQTQNAVVDLSQRSR